MKRYRSFFVILSAALGLCVAAGATQAQELGRLFYTPVQRAAMERDVSTRQPDAAARLDGQIRRSDGKTVNWINGTLAEDSAEAQSLLQRHLKVGQSVEIRTGAVHDGLKGGRVVVREQP